MRLLEPPRTASIHRVIRRMISVVIFFRIFEIIIFCFSVAICDLVHDVETIFQLFYLLTASGNLQKNAVSRASLIFQKLFPDAVNT